MDYTEAKRFQEASEIVARYSSRAYTQALGNGTRLLGDGFFVDYQPEETVIYLSRHNKAPWGGQNYRHIFPAGVRWVRYDNPTKEYAAFIDGTGKEVHYVIPPEGLRLHKVRTVLDTDGNVLAHQYHPLNPTEDYVIEIDKVKAKDARKKVEDFINYIKNLWDMLEIPEGFVAEDGKALPNPTDPDTWYDFAVMRKFYYRRRSQWAKPKWKWRTADTATGRWDRTPSNIAAEGNKQTILSEVYAELTKNDLAYSVRLKSPYTEPHHNQHWAQLKALRQAGQLPVCETKKTTKKRKSKKST